MGLAARSTVVEQDIHQISSTQQGALGLIAETKDGRVFRYGLAGAADLAVGKLVQQSAVVANHQNVVVTGSAGDMTAVVTLGATLATADQYKDGYLSGLSGTGAGQTVRIRTHGAAALSTALTLYLAEPLTTTFASTPKASLTKNPYAGGIISASGETTQQVTGVPIITVTTAYYGWFQTKGIAAVLVNGTPAVGSGLIKSATTPGAADIEATTTITQRIGQVYDTAAVSTSYVTANLNIQV